MNLRDLIREELKNEPLDHRVVLDKRRLHTAITHPDWAPGHSLNDAMRIASKALLRDMWCESRNIHHPELAHCPVGE